MLFDEKITIGAIVTSKEGAKVNEVLAEELHKPVIEKFEKRKICLRFKDNIWTADLTKMK